MNSITLSALRSRARRRGFSVWTNRGGPYTERLGAYWLIYDGTIIATGEVDELAEWLAAPGD